MVHAARIRGFGGPEAFEWLPIEIDAPAAHEVRVTQRAIGVNAVDLYMRAGNHPARLTFPATLGFEAAGVVEAVGSEVKDFSRGDRIAYFGVLGAYAQERLVPAQRLLRVPAALDDQLIAASTVKGITAYYLCRQAYRVGRDDIVLIHAAAGGVGSILAQWCASLGATVIGTVGHDHKTKFAASHGCQHVIVSSHESVAERVAEVSDGQKASVVFDALGGEFTLASLDCLRPRGTLVIFGRAAGYPRAIVPFEHLMQRGSLSVTMTQLADFTGTRADIEAAWNALCAAIASGAVRPAIGQTFPLAMVGEAHREMEARRTVGATILLT